MTLEGPIRQAETARADLSKVQLSSDGWADTQRRQFDSQRMKPLLDAGAQLTVALKKAHEQCQRAERLLNADHQ